MSLPDGYITRPATMDDLDAVHSLFLACSLAEHGSPDFSRAELLSWWRDEGFDLTTDSLLVFAPVGSLAGFADISADPSGGLNFSGRVHPEHAGRGVGGFLVAWAEERVEAVLAASADMGSVALHQWVSVRNLGARDLLLARDYQPVRRFWRMHIELDEPQEPPILPHEVTIRTLRLGQDEEATHEAVQDAFHDHWRHPYLSFDRWARREIEREDFDPSLWFLAVEGDEIVGVAHCRTDGDMGWIDELGVRPAWRRRGIARALLHTVFGAFYGRDVRSVGLGVDAQSETGARKLYERAGMRVYREWDIYEKSLSRS